VKGNGQQQLVYRLLLAVDIQGYSKRDVREQLLAQRQLSDALNQAACGVGLDRGHWDKQVGGDGELATLPEGVEPAPLHHGTLMAGPFGPAGDAPIVVQRLLDAGPLRRLLVDDAHRDLAYVVSDSLFEDVVQTGFCALPPEAFEPIKVTAKGAAFRGHILTGRLAQGGDTGGDEYGGPGSRPAAAARVFDVPALVLR